MADIPLSQVPRAVGRRSLVGTPTRLPSTGVAVGQALEALGAKMAQVEAEERGQALTTAKARLGTEVEIGLNEAKALALAETDPDLIFEVYQRNATARLEGLSGQLEDPENEELLDLYQAQKIAQDQSVLATHSRNLRRGNAMAELETHGRTIANEIRESVTSPLDIAASVARMEAQIQEAALDKTLSDAEMQGILNQSGEDIELGGITTLVQNKSYKMALEAERVAKYISPEQSIAIRKNITDVRSSENLARVLTAYVDASDAGTFIVAAARAEVDLLHNTGVMTGEHRFRAITLIRRLSDVKAGAPDLEARISAFVNSDGSITGTPKQMKQLFTELSRRMMPKARLQLRAQGFDDPTPSQIAVYIAENHKVVDPTYLAEQMQIALNDPDLEEKAKAMEVIDQIFQGMGNNNGLNLLDTKGQKVYTGFKDKMFGVTDIGNKDRSLRNVGTQVGPPERSPDPRIGAKLTTGAAALLAMSESDNLTSAGRNLAQSALEMNRGFNSMSRTAVDAAVERAFENLPGGIPGAGMLANMGYVDTGVRASFLAAGPIRFLLGDAFQVNIGHRIIDMVHRRAQSLAIESGGVYSRENIGQFYNHAAADIMETYKLMPDLFNARGNAKGDPMIGTSTVNGAVPIVRHKFGGEPGWDPWKSQVDIDIARIAIGNLEPKRAEALTEAINIIGSSMLYSHRLPAGELVNRGPVPSGSPLPIVESFANLINLVNPDKTEALNAAWALADRLELSNQEVMDYFSTQSAPSFKHIVAIYAKVRGSTLPQAWQDINLALFGQNNDDPKEVVLINALRNDAEGDRVPVWNIAMRSDSSLFPQMLTVGGETASVDFNHVSETQTVGLNDPSVAAQGVKDRDKHLLRAAFEEETKAHEAKWQTRVTNFIGMGLLNKITSATDFVGTASTGITQKQAKQNRAQAAIDTLTEERMNEGMRSFEQAVFSTQVEKARYLFRESGMTIEQVTQGISGAGIVPDPISPDDWEQVVQALKDEVESYALSPEDGFGQLQKYADSIMPANQAEIISGYGVGIKDGVNTDGLKPEALLAVFRYKELMNFLKVPGDQQMVTSGIRDMDDAVQTFVENGDKTLHPMGYAVDLRGHQFSLEEGTLAAAQLKAMLPDGYQVIFETKDRNGRNFPQSEWHFHIQFKSDEVQKEMDALFSEQKRLLDETA